VGGLHRSNEETGRQANSHTELVMRSRKGCFEIFELSFLKKRKEGCKRGSGGAFNPLTTEV